MLTSIVSSASCTFGISTGSGLLSVSSKCSFHLCVCSDSLESISPFLFLTCKLLCEYLPVSVLVIVCRVFRSCFTAACSASFARFSTKAFLSALHNFLTSLFSSEYLDFNLFLILSDFVEFSLFLMVFLSSILSQVLVLIHSSFFLLLKPNTFSPVSWTALLKQSSVI